MGAQASGAGAEVNIPDEAVEAAFEDIYMKAARIAAEQEPKRGSTVSDEAVEAAAKAHFERGGGRWEDWTQEDKSVELDDMRATLVAAAPHLMAECEAEALEDAADAFPSYGPERAPVDAITWLQERAAMIRKGIHP